MADQIGKKTVDNTRVVEAIAAIRAEGTQENSHALTAALVHEETVFLVPVGEDGKSIMTLTAPDGKRFLPAYTSGAEMQKNPSVTPKQRLVLVDLIAFHKMMKQNEGAFAGVVIDPQSLSFPLSPELVERLSQHKEVLAKRPKGPVSILCPKDGFSNDMTKAVGKALYQVPEVDSCFLRIAQRGEGENVQRNWLFIVEYYGEDFASVVRLICETCKPFLTDGAQVDVAPYSSELGQRVTEKGDPFFRRQMLWV